jgi:hypothetical protein
MVQEVVLKLLVRIASFHHYTLYVLALSTGSPHCSNHQVVTLPGVAHGLEVNCYVGGPGYTCTHRAQSQSAHAAQPVREEDEDRAEPPAKTTGDGDDESLAVGANMCWLHLRVW